jgi:hypothetical protein
MVSLTSHPGLAQDWRGHDRQWQPAANSGKGRSRQQAGQTQTMATRYNQRRLAEEISRLVSSESDSAALAPLLGTKVSKPVRGALKPGRSELSSNSKGFSRQLSLSVWLSTLFAHALGDSRTTSTVPRCGPPIQL